MPELQLLQHSHGQVNLGIWQPFTMLMSCQAFHNHVTAICNLAYQLPQKVNGEDIRKDCKHMLPPERNPSTFSGLAEKVPL